MNYSITVIIHSYNSEPDIGPCIDSAKLLTDDVIVIDMESTDKTVSIAKNSGVEVCSFPYSQYVEPSRQFGIEKAKTDWVFLLDTDERITNETANEIRSVISHVPHKKTFYKVPRKNIFGTKKWLSHGGWWPDYQIRLINKHSFIRWPKEIHSTPSIKGESGFLDNPLLHYFHGNLSKMVEKTILFENIESDLLYKAGKSVNTGTFFRKFFGELYRRMFRQRGFMDGPIGIMESIYQAFSKTITYLFLYEKKNSSSV